MTDDLQILRAKIERLDHQGRYTELLPLVEQVLALTEQRYGAVNAEHIAVLNELGGVHRDIGNYTQAATAYTQAIEAAAAVFGNLDPNYATTVNNAAGLYRLMEQHEKAEGLFQQA